MTTKSSRIICVTLGVIAFASCTTRGQTEVVAFGPGTNRLEIEFVSVGDPGNPPAEFTNGMGVVDYSYQIAKYEAPCILDLKTLQLGAHDEPGNNNCIRGEQLPSTLTWEAVAQIANWMNTSSGYPPAYSLEFFSDPEIGSRLHVLQEWPSDSPGYDPENTLRDTRAKYVIPTKDEWHKAAYYNPELESFHTWSTGNVRPAELGADSGTDPFSIVTTGRAPVTQAGGLSYYGTMGQSGNIEEWEESPFNPDNPLGPHRGPRGIRAGTVYVRPGDLPGHASTLSRLRDVGGINGFRFVALEQPAPRAGDANTDGNVDFVDFLKLSENFSQPGTWLEGDFNNDGYVRFEDFLDLATNFDGNQQIAAVPEPNGATLGALALLGLACRLRRDRHRKHSRP